MRRGESLTPPGAVHDRSFVNICSVSCPTLKGTVCPLLFGLGVGCLGDHLEPLPPNPLHDRLRDTPPCLTLGMWSSSDPDLVTRPSLCPVSVSRVAEHLDTRSGDPQSTTSWTSHLCHLSRKKTTDVKTRVLPPS